MHTLSFKDRAAALENEFYKRVDDELLRNMRRDLAEREAKEAIRSASGIQNDEVLAELVRIEVQAETLAAVSLIPLVAIAWADGKVADGERAKILAVEGEAGISPESLSHQLLNHWLDHDPGEELFSTWKHFVHELRGRISLMICPLLDRDLIDRAEAVAKASGGYWSYGSVSPRENRVLAEVRKVLEEARPT